MKALVQHLVRENLAQIAAGSLLHCHVRGLHSIMLIDTPEQRIRLFIATKDHQLYHNTAETLGSLAAHPHHCNITLHCIKGGFTNLMYRQKPVLQEVEYVAYTYQSAILTGVGSFARAEAPSAVFVGSVDVERGDSLALAANAIHSVYITQGRETAWFVYEGREDKNYSSLSYSDQPLDKTSFEGLYFPMPEETVISLLTSVGLL
jgi:hypothetical protein